MNIYEYLRLRISGKQIGQSLDSKRYLHHSMTVSQHLLEHLTAFSIGKNGLPRTLLGIELKVNNCHSPYCGTGL